MNSKQKFHLELNLHGEKILVNTLQIDPKTTLNDVLRNKNHLTGVKYMCREGGCGVCVVTIKYKHPITNKETTLAINSCLLSIFQCSNEWNIKTVEGLASSDNKLHPIQETLLKFNGSQCGFCTPGMLMNMDALYESGNFKMEEIENSFGGNLCRCTGYRPILTAFKSMAIDADTEIIGETPDIEDLPKCRAKEILQGSPNTCSKINSSFMFDLGAKGKWFNIQTILEALEVMKMHKNKRIKIVGGNTAMGVYYDMGPADVYIDVFLAKELRNFELNTDSLILGANMTLTELIDVCKKTSKNNPNQFNYLSKFADHVELVAHVPIRNVGTIAGNLSIKHANNEFASDIFLLLEVIGAKLTIIDIKQKETIAKPSEYLKLNMQQKLITSINLPALNKDQYKFESYKVMPRAQNAHAIVNAGFLLQLKDNKVQSATIVYGGINPNFIHAKNSEKFLVGKNIFTNSVMQELFATLDKEIVPDYVLPDPKPEFRKQLAISLAYKFILSIASNISPRNVLGGEKLTRDISKGTQEYETNKSMYPISQPTNKLEAKAQITGEAEYVMDKPDHPNQLYAAFVEAKAAPNSVIKSIDTKEALALPGVVAFIGKDDIPGENNISPKSTNLPESEELFCSKVVKFYFQPVGLIVAKDQNTAEKGAELVKIIYESSEKKPLIKIRDILAKDPSKVKKEEGIPRKKTGTDVKYTVKGKFDISWQYHFSMETQCCFVIPKENGEYDMYPSTQWMDLVQIAAASCIGVKINKINLQVRRCGGAYGAKLTRANIPACAAIVAAAKLKKPIKLWMSFIQTMNICGKRTPIAADYTIKLNEKGIIQSLDMSLWVDCGLTRNDKSLPNIISAFSESYNSDAFQVNLFTTNSDNHTATYARAPGSLEGHALIESIMEHAAYAANLDPLDVRLANLNTLGHPLLKTFIEELQAWADIDKRLADVKKFNEEHRWRKKGLSVVPMTFSLDFFGAANIIISIYQGDGSIAVSHGGIEIGQGINTKIAQVVAYKLGVPLDKISIKASNTLTSPNNMPTAGSQTSESHCMAALKACDELNGRLLPIRIALKIKLQRDPKWNELIMAAFMANVDLVARYMHAGNLLTESYKVYGVAAVEIEYDVLTGNHIITRADILEDTGTSLNPYIDIGQTEGAFTMGLGRWTSEEIIQEETGEIKNNRTWNYKVPGAKDIPVDFRVKFPKNVNPISPMKSKATSEPPICLSFAVVLAFRQIIREMRAELKNDESWIPIDGPNSVEFNFMACLPDFKNYTL